MKKRTDRRAPPNRNLQAQMAPTKRNGHKRGYAVSRASVRYAVH